MLILSILDISISNAFSAIYVDTVDTFPTQIYSHVMVCMSMQLTKLNYNVDSNMKSSNYSEIRFKAFIYFELQQKFEIKLRINPLRIRYQLNVL